MKTILLLFTICAGIVFMGYSSTSLGVGVVLLEIPDSVNNGVITTAVFYPSADPTGTTSFGFTEIAAERGVDPVIKSGGYPLVLISHGNGGGWLGLHDIATHLASQGYVVAALEHPGDNYKDQSGIGTDRVHFGRAVQVSKTLDILLKDSPVTRLIDKERVGAIGHSAGSYTVMMAVGAIPPAEQLAKFCISNADFILCEGNGEILISDPAVIPKADDRIGAIVALAPVGRAIFNPESLALISVPVYLYAAGNDHILPPNDNVHYLKANLKSSDIVKIIPDAGHFVFLSPCSDALKNEFPDLCIDPPGIDRTDVHEKLIRDIVNFFDNSL